MKKYLPPNPIHNLQYPYKVRNLVFPGLRIRIEWFIDSGSNNYQKFVTLHMKYKNYEYSGSCEERVINN